MNIGETLKVVDHLLHELGPRKDSAEFEAMTTEEFMAYSDRQDNILDQVRVIIGTSIPTEEYYTRLSEDQIWMMNRAINSDLLAELLWDFLPGDPLDTGRINFYSLSEFKIFKPREWKAIGKRFLSHSPSFINRYEMNEWMLNNLGEFKVHQANRAHLISFKNKDDAMIWKLVWCGR